MKGTKLLRASCPPPFGPAELFKFAPDEFVRKNLAASASCSLRRLKAPTVGAPGLFSRLDSTTCIHASVPSERRIATLPVGDLGRFPFHLRRAFLPGWLTQGCSSVSNPFTGEKIHRIFSFIRFTHSYGYASAGDQPTLFAIFPLNFVPFMQHAG